jgi:hypothetical protein
MWCVLALIPVEAFVLLAPTMPEGGLQGSWTYSLNEAVAHRLIFGKDIIFTFGPYASIYTRLYSPSTVWGMLLGSLVLGSLFFACLAWLARETRGSSLTILVLILAVLEAPAYYPDALLFSIPLLVSLAVFKLQITNSGDALGKKSAVTLVLLAFAGLGLLPLVKQTLLLLVAGVCLACAVFLVANGRRVLALACPAATGFSMVAFWVSAGQPLWALPGFLASARTIISGYSDAMSVDGSHQELAVFAVGAAMVLFGIAAHRELTLAQRGFLLLMFSLFLFLAFKEGFVREDGHFLVAMNCLSFSCLFLLLLDAGAKPAPGRRLVLAGALMVTVLTGATEWRNNFAYDAAKGGGSLMQHEDEPSGAWFMRLIKEAGYAKVMAMIVSAAPLGGVVAPRLGSWSEDFSASNRAINESSGLNFALQGRVDVYSFEQSSLFARGYQWDPRPVLQSYSAYTPELIRLDEQHLRSSGAPDHLIFRLETIDDHLPSMDDGLSWPAMLDNYSVAGSSGNWVLLNRKSGTIKRVSAYIPLGTVAAELGEEVSIPEASGPVFVEVHATLSTVGKLIDLAYKVPWLSIRVTRKDGEQSEYRVNADMMETGFVLSPLITTNEEFVRLFDPGATLHGGNEIKSFTLKVSGRKTACWNKGYTAAFEQYEY